MRISILLTCLFFAIAIRANDLTVDRHVLRAGEALTITVSLEGDFATIDDLSVPVRNLTLSPAPSMLSNFSWINGTVVRRRVFRFTARANAAGQAQVGPFAIALPDGRRFAFAAVFLQVLPKGEALSNDPPTLLRDLAATGRDPFFIVAEASQREAYVGEEVVVTWWLYNAATMQESQIGAIPRLSDFWVEEVDVRSAQPTEALVGGSLMQRIPIRRVALFPLHDGPLRIGSMELEAKVMRRTRPGSTDDSEWALIDSSFSSAPLTLNVRPLPASAAGAIVGDLTLTCSPPVQKNGGPVLIDVTLRGRANVRAASTPRFTHSPAADVQIVERGTVLDRGPDVPSMTRRWQYLLSPRRAGTLAIPEMSLRSFSPSAGEPRLLRCQGTTVGVTSASPGQPSGAEQSPQGRSVLSRATRVGEWLVAASALVLLFTFVSNIVQRRRTEAASIRALVSDRSPSEIRDAVHHRLADRGIDTGLLLIEHSDRGDAYRALRSLLDGLERDRISAGPDEVTRRVRELMESLQSAA